MDLIIEVMKNTRDLVIGRGGKWVGWVGIGQFDTDHGLDMGRVDIGQG